MSAVMNALWAPFLAVAAVFVAAAGGAAWWHQRRNIAELKRRLQEAESSRRDISEHMAVLRQRLDGAKAKPAAGDDIAERKRALEPAAGPAAEFPWLETMPAPDAGEASEFEPTRPDHLRTERQRLDVNLEEVAPSR